jgi:hypothetical protein
MKIGLTAIPVQLVLLLFVMACSRVGSDVAADSAERTAEIDVPASIGTPEAVQARPEGCIPRDERIKELRAELDEALRRYTERFPDIVEVRRQSERLQGAAPALCDEPI